MSRVLTGGRCTFTFNGDPVGFASGVEEKVEFKPLIDFGMNDFIAYHEDILRKTMASFKMDVVSLSETSLSDVASTVFGMERAQNALLQEEPVSLEPGQLKRMAEMLRVDEVVEFGALRPAHCFALRIGQLVRKVEITQQVFEDYKPAAALDFIARQLFDAARELKMRAEQEKRRDALRAQVGSARPITSADVIEFVPLRMPVSSVFDLDERFTRASNAPVELEEGATSEAADLTDGQKKLNRFDAIMQEIENP